MSVSHEDLMRYLDGELPPGERRRVEEALEGNTELGRELAIFQAMKSDLLDLSFAPDRPRDGVWNSVSRRIVRPTGWLFLVGGAALWAGYGAYVFATSPGELLEKLATGGVVIGILLLLASVIHEQYQDWLRDPYRDVHR